MVDLSAKRHPRIAIIGSRGFPSFYGGFETAVRKLAPFLAENELDVLVYSRRKHTIGTTKTHDNVRRVFSWGFDRKSVSTISYGFFATLHCVLTRPKVALVMNVANGYWLPILKVLGIKTLVNVDGIEWQRDKWSALGKRAFLIGAKLVARFADEIVCDSKAIGDFWQENFGRRGVFIPYGGEATFPTTLREEFESKSYVLMVARLVPENSIQEFLDAIELLNKEVPVVIVGTSSYGQDFQNKISHLLRNRGNLFCLGHISDDRRLLSLWANAGVYFHGHTVGGTNPALVQAMFCGAPTVARDTLFNREVLEHAGVFVSSSPKEIAAAISTLMENPRERARLSELGKTRVAQEYTWQKVNESYLREILSLAHAG